jgi:hypothetical protein
MLIGFLRTALAQKLTHQRKPNFDSNGKVIKSYEFSKALKRPGDWWLSPSPCPTFKDRKRVRDAASFWAYYYGKKIVTRIWYQDGQPHLMVILVTPYEFQNSREARLTKPIPKA